MEKTAGRFFEIPKRKEKLVVLLEDQCVKSWIVFSLSSYLYSCTYNVESQVNINILVVNQSA